MPQGSGAMRKPQSGLLGLLFWCCGNREELLRDVEANNDAEGDPTGSITNAETTEVGVAARTVKTESHMEQTTVTRSQPSSLTPKSAAPDSSATTEPIPAPDTPPPTTAATSQSSNPPTHAPPVAFVEQQHEERHEPVETEQPTDELQGTGEPPVKDAAPITEDWVVVASEAVEESSKPTTTTEPSAPDVDTAGNCASALIQESTSQLSAVTSTLTCEESTLTAEVSTLTAEASVGPLIGDEVASSSREPTVAVTVGATSAGTSSGGPSQKGGKKGGSKKKNNGQNGGGKKGGGGGKKGKKRH